MKDPFPPIYKNVTDLTKKNPHEWWLLKIVAAVVIAGIIIICLPPCNKPTPEAIKDKQIIKQVEQDIKAPVAKADSFKRLVTDSAKMIVIEKQKAYYWQQESKRLASLKDKILADTNLESRNGTLAEYIDDLTHSAANSDTSNNIVIRNLDKQLEHKDSIITQTELQRDIFKHGFNDMAANSQAKDKAIKDLNKKLRVKKVTGVVKSLAIVAGIVYLITKK